MRPLLVVLGSSLVLKAGLLLTVGDLPPIADELQYVVAGHSIAAGQGIAYTAPMWDPLTQPPLYPWFLGGLFFLGSGLLGAKAVQVLLSTVTAAFVYALGRRVAGPRAGLVACAAFAFDPTLVAFTHYFWAETLFLLWWVLGLWVLLEAEERRASRWPLIVAGASLGLAALTRSFVPYGIPLVALWVWNGAGRTRAGALRGALLAVGFATVLLPPAISTWKRYGGWVPISSSAIVWYRNYNLWPPFNADWGFQKARPAARDVRPVVVDGERSRPPVRTDDPVERSREETRRGIAFALAHPGLVARQSAMRAVEFLNPTSFLVRHLRLGIYERDASGAIAREPPSPVLREAVIVFAVASYVGVSVAAVLGLFSMKPGQTRSLLVTTILYTIAIHSLTVAMSRYRLALTPLLCVAAGALFAAPGPGERLRSALASPTRRYALCALGVGLVFSWGAHIGRIWTY